jgi:predicted ester cyclase
MPDLAVSLDEVAVVGPQVWAQLRFSATHRGELLGQPGKSRRVSYDGQAVHDVRDGRLSRVWVVADTLSLYRQLVANTAPGT